MKAGSPAARQMKQALLASLVSASVVTYWSYSTVSTEQANFARQMKVMDHRLKQMEAEQIRQQILSPMETAVFDVKGERKFQIIRSNIGSVLMMLERVEPTPSGIRVFLRLGNPLSVEYKGFTAKVQLKLKVDGPEAAKPGNLTSTEIDIKDSLPPSSWTTVSFEVATDHLEQIQTIVFTPTFSGILLPRRRGKSPHDDNV